MPPLWSHPPTAGSAVYGQGGFFLFSFLILMTSNAFPPPLPLPASPTKRTRQGKRKMCVSGIYFRQGPIFIFTLRRTAQKCWSSKYWNLFLLCCVRKDYFMESKHTAGSNQFGLPKKVFLQCKERVIFSTEEGKLSPSELTNHWPEICGPVPSKLLSAQCPPFPCFRRSLLFACGGGKRGGITNGT